MNNELERKNVERTIKEMRLLMLTEEWKKLEDIEKEVILQAFQHLCCYKYKRSEEVKNAED